MKQIVLTSWMLLIAISAYAISDDCANAHSKANYAISHTKKALKADNFDHQKYYAGRAIEAFEKTSAYIENCGCEDAKLAIFDGLANLKKAVEPDDWDKGRFYTKRAYANAEQLMAALDICSTGTSTNNYSSEILVNTNTSNIEKEKEILDAQQKLIERQQALLQEQKELEAKLNQQRQIAEQQEQVRLKELQQQIKLKVRAEQALDNFEKSILELTKILDCKDAYDITFESYQRAEKVLESESLTGTKKYYAERAKAIASKALNKLKDCAF